MQATDLGQTQEPPSNQLQVQSSSTDCASLENAGPVLWIGSSTWPSAMWGQWNSTVRHLFFIALQTKTFKSPDHPCTDTHQLSSITFQLNTSKSPYRRPRLDSSAPESGLRWRWGYRRKYGPPVFSDFQRAANFRIRNDKTLPCHLEEMFRYFETQGFITRRRRRRSVGAYSSWLDVKAHAQHHHWNWSLYWSLQWLPIFSLFCLCGTNIVKASQPRSRTACEVSVNRFTWLWGDAMILLTRNRGNLLLLTMGTHTFPIQRFQSWLMEGTH